MVQAIKKRAVVGPSGRILIDRTELPEGTVAEVIVLVDDPPADSPKVLQPFSSFIGAMRGQFPSAGDADAFLRQLRDEWDQG